MADPVPVPFVTAWSLTVPEAMEDEASGLVWTAGCAGVTVEKTGAATLRLVCFYDEAETHEGEIQGIAAQLGTTATKIQVPNPDWVQKFKETFITFDVPPFRIVPDWVKDPPAAGRDRSPFMIRVDPGRAFGTGAHESTRLCLETLGAIARHLGKEPRTLDLGCGSGILGIAAIRIANARVTACDFDPLAIAVARKHARLNQVGLRLLQMDGCRSLRAGRFDLVLANLMAPFLISRVDEITAVGAPGCRYILAGLLREEEDAVRAAWPEDWKASSTYQGEWASLLYEQP
ncbi:MAG: 50S ribosomal protein L11 methyltransferase [Vicinamibacteria bacterium]